jgi:hypothetical protein
MATTRRFRGSGRPCGHDGQLQLHTHINDGSAAITAPSLSSHEKELPLVIMDITSLFAAVLFFTGNLMIIIFRVKEGNRSHWNSELHYQLDPDYLQQEWDFRNKYRVFYQSAALVNACAWFFFAIPMIQLAWVLSHRGTKSVWLHICIAVLTLAGSFTEWISRFLHMGQSLAAHKLSTEGFNLDNWIASNSDDGLGWKTLEVTYIMASGLIWFIDAFEWIAIFFIMLLVHVSVRRWRTTDQSTFGACWNLIGLFIGLLSVLDFVAEILRLDGFRTFRKIAYWYASINRLILLPIWLILLGIQLPYAIMKTNQQTADSTTNTPGENGAFEST